MKLTRATVPGNVVERMVYPRVHSHTFSVIPGITVVTSHGRRFEGASFFTYSAGGFRGLGSRVLV